MCGIFGYLGPDASDLNTDASSLAHRGPDDSGEFRATADGTEILFSHTRLSIIGLGEQGRQPFVSGSGDVVLIYNGEVYNYQRLKDVLRSEHGCEFTTETDTEVLLEGYRAWGIERLLEEVVGIFGFGLLDRERDRAYVVRDHLGVKPVYYTGGQSFMFASEAKALLETGGLEARLNHEVLGEYLANFWVHEPDTLFADVFKLEAGSYIEYDIETNEREKHSYWDPLADSEQSTDLGSLLDRVVGEQMVSDVPLGVYLSGGIDSTLVTYYAAEHADDSLLALNLNNETDDEHDEFSNVRALEGDLSLDVESFEPAESMLDIYKEMIYYLDEPIADPAVIPAYLLADEARSRDVKVMLSGMGGDEIFGGYRRMQIVANRSWLKPLWPLAKTAASLWPDRDSEFRRNLGRIASFLRDPIPERYYTLAYYFTEDEITTLLNDADWTERYDEKIRGFLRDREFTDAAQQFQYLDLRGYLSSHNLLYIDKASMARGVEVRVPLLDHRLVEQFFNRPTATKLDGGLKGELRSLVADKLGARYTKHSKQGFGFPIKGYLDSGQMRSELEAMVADERLQKIIDAEAVQKMIDDQFAGKADNSMKIWAIYTLWLWLEEFDVAVE